MQATQAAIAALPEEQRSVLVLVCVEEMSYRDAASTLDIPVGTVMSRLARARAAVAATLEGDAGAARGRYGSTQMSGEARITDEMLMAYVDGELPPEVAAAVERAAAEPQIARRIDGFRRSRAATREAFAGLLRCAAACASGSLPSCRRAGRHGATALPCRSPPRWLWSSGSGATGPAGYLSRRRTTWRRWPARRRWQRRWARSRAAPRSISALARLVLTGTYPIPDGLCRSFALTRGSEALRGVGCDHGGGWRTELLVTDTTATAGAAPASGPAAELVDGFLDSAGAGAALPPAEEAGRLRRQ